MAFQKDSFLVVVWDLELVLIEQVEWVYPTANDLLLAGRSNIYVTVLPTGQA